MSDKVGQRRVLVVDDEWAARTGLARLLGHAGYDAESAGSFKEARQILQTRAPDLLIVDVRLDEYNGLQLIIDTPNTVKKIVVSGFPDPLLEDEARRHGAAYLTKPIDSVDLLRVIDELFA